MNINPKILHPSLSEVIGRKDMELELVGETLGDLVDQLVAQFGPEV
jgi:hypothetical protein